MIIPGLNKFRILAAAALLALAAASTPAKASHDSDIIVPLAAFIAIGALVNSQQHSYYRYSYRSHYGPPYHGSHYGSHYHGSHYHGSHYQPHIRHSHSYGGYSEPRYKHHRNW